MEEGLGWEDAKEREEGEGVWERHLIVKVRGLRRWFSPYFLRK